MQCPTHKILLEYDTNSLSHYCYFCKKHYNAADTAIDTLNGQEGAYEYAPENLFNKIKYDVTRSMGRIKIRATLPKGFSMTEFTRIYFLKDAADYNMSDEEYIEVQKREMMKDLIQRIKIERG